MKNNIASERAKLGLSQEQLANILNVSRDSIGNWEQGTTSPKSDAVVRLANIFNCSIDYLLCRSEDRMVHSPTNVADRD